VAALSLLLGALALCALQASWAWQWGLTGRLLGMLTLGALAALTLDLWLARQAFTRVPTFSRSLAPSGGVAQERGRRRNREGLVRGQGMASADLRLAGADALALGAVLALALALRLPWVTAPDPVGDLELSARRAATLAAEGLAGAYAGGGGNDYLPLRLYLLWGMGLLARSLGLMLDSPLSPGAAWLMKLPWLLADLATTALLYLWSRRRARLRGAALIALAYAAMPQIWLNVAWWGQVDALLVLLMLGALLLLIRAATQGGHGLAGAWFVLGCALLVKLQAIILLPLLGLLTLRLWRLAGLLRGATMLGVTLGLGMLPLVLAGQTPGLLEAYLGSVGRFNGVTINAFNIWYFVAPGVYVPDTEPWALGLSYRQIGVVLLGMAALLIGLLAALRVPATWPAHWLEAAALTALAFFLLPTQIHERYLYLCFAFLAARLASAPALWLPFLLLSLSATVNVFGTLDFWPALRAYLAVPWIGKSLALLNLLVFVGLLLHLGGLAPRQRLRTGLVKA
jgi:Gpi18-like mannosyltransferase